jgi:hypothetical protein
MGGDRPFVRYGADVSIHSQIVVGLRRGPTTHWLHNLSSGYTSAFKAGAMAWFASPIAGDPVAINWTVVALADDVGTASIVSVSGGVEGDTLVVLVGGSYKVSGGRPLGWTYDGAVNPANLLVGFSPELSHGSRASLSPSPGSFQVQSTVAGVTVDGEMVADPAANLTLSIITLTPDKPSSANSPPRELVLVAPTARYTPESVVGPMS